MSKNVKTRQDTDKLLYAGDNVYKFSPIASFPGPPFQLPTQRQVLLQLIQEKHRKAEQLLRWFLRS